jgi:hypothetical protein
MFAFDDGPIKVTPSKQNNEHANPWSVHAAAKHQHNQVFK